MKSILRVIALSFSVVTINSLADIRNNYFNESLVRNLPSAVAVDVQKVDVDVVVFYQPSYVKKFGAYAAFDRIESLVKVANDSYASHGLNYSLSVSDILPVESVGDEVPYQDVKDDAGKVVKDGANYLFSLAALNSGNPEFDLYQRKWNADLVIYVRELREEDTIRGLAGIGGEFSSVLDDGLETNNNTILAHEVGHNIGLNHEDGEASTGPNYARAWLCGGMRTIMYSENNRDSSLLHYSTPLLSHLGEACGNEQANNALVLKEKFLSTSLRRAGVVSLGAVSFVDSEFSGDEKSGVVVKLQRSGDLSEAASVKVFSSDGSAVWGSDYTDAFVVADFGVGVGTTSVLFPVVDDGVSEGSEGFSVELKYPYKLNLGSLTTANLLVADGAVDSDVGIFSVTGVTEVVEGDSTEILISRVGGVGEVVISVNTMSDSATASIDFVELNQGLVFAEGELEKIISVTTLDDALYEGTESFDISISSPNDSVGFGVSSLIVDVLDNDEVPKNVGVFSLKLDTDSVSESVGSVAVKVVRADGVSGSVKLRVYTEGMTAKAGVDFVAVDSEVVFLDGESEKTVVVNIIDDDINEVGESRFGVKLESDVDVVGESSVTIKLVDNDNSVVVEESGNSSGGGLGATIVLLSGLLLARRRGFNGDKKSI